VSKLKLHLCITKKITIMTQQLQRVQIASSHIKFNAQGQCVRITWYRLADGSKMAEVVPYSPGAIEINAMARNPYGEAYISKKEKLTF
jgi:hypothetical protein